MPELRMSFIALLFCFLFEAPISHRFILFSHVFPFRLVNNHLNSNKCLGSNFAVICFFFAISFYLSSMCVRVCTSHRLYIKEMPTSPSSSPDTNSKTNNQSYFYLQINHVGYNFVIHHTLNKVYSQDKKKTKKNTMWQRPLGARGPWAAAQTAQQQRDKSGCWKQVSYCLNLYWKPHWK